MKILINSLVSISIASLFISCGNSNSENEKVKPIDSKSKKVTVERGAVFNAKVEDSNGQVANSTENSNIYIFEKEIKFPVKVTGGQIDMNNDGKIDQNDANLKVTLYSYSNVVNPITTYLGNPKDSNYEEKLIKLIDVNKKYSKEKLSKALTQSILKDIDLIKLSSAVYVPLRMGKMNEITSENLKNTISKFTSNDLNSIEKKTLELANAQEDMVSKDESNEIDNNNKDKYKNINEEIKRLDNIKELKVSKTNLDEFFGKIVTKEKDKNNLTKEDVKVLLEQFPSILENEITSVTKSFAIDKDIDKQLLLVKITLKENSVSKSKELKVTGFYLGDKEIIKKHKEKLEKSIIKASQNNDKTTKEVFEYLASGVTLQNGILRVKDNPSSANSEISFDTLNSLKLKIDGDDFDLKDSKIEGVKYEDIKITDKNDHLNVSLLIVKDYDNQTSSFKIYGFKTKEASEEVKIEAQELSKKTNLYPNYSIKNEYEYSLKELTDKINAENKTAKKNSDFKSYLDQFLNSSDKNFIKDENFKNFNYEFVKAEAQGISLDIEIKVSKKNDKEDYKNALIKIVKIPSVEDKNKYRPIAIEKNRIQELIGSNNLNIDGNSKAKEKELYKTFNELTNTNGEVGQGMQKVVSSSKVNILKSLMPSEIQDKYFPDGYSKNGADYNYKISHSDEGLSVNIFMNINNEEDSNQDVSSAIVISKSSFKTENIEETVNKELLKVNSEINKLNSKTVVADAGYTLKGFIEDEGPEITLDKTDWMEVESYMEYIFKDSAVPEKYSSVIKDGYTHPSSINGVTYTWKIKYVNDTTLNAKIVLTKSDTVKESSEFIINGFKQP